VGLLSLSRRSGSARRHQFALAAIRHSNQLLAAVALVVATTILMKMGRLRWIWVTLLPMAWLVVITMTASYQKIFHSNPRIGFLAYANAWLRKSRPEKFPPRKLPKRSASFSTSASMPRSPPFSPP